jgi:hypothetical protein
MMLHRGNSELSLRPYAQACPVRAQALCNFWRIFSNTFHASPQTKSVEPAVNQGQSRHSQTSPFYELWDPGGSSSDVFPSVGGALKPGPSAH